MGEGIPGLASAYTVLFTAALIFLAILLVFCLIRAIIGPRVADRLVAVNMMGTIVMVIIAILTLMLQEGYLADICLIYAMISFLAVIVLTKVYMGVYLEKKETASRAAVGQTKAADCADAESMISDTAGKEKSNGNV
ncbi:MAG: monovalent cation/H+ antiporter complex subunit F [Lachnospiraceae bacterium]|nr:monovalent cation/H+ antiporter complex subunit F [Lachnospiraceae bacterium]